MIIDLIQLGKSQLGRLKRQLLIFLVNVVFLKSKLVCGKFDQERSRDSSKIKNCRKLLKLETRVLKLTIYGKFVVNEQLLSWPLFYMIKTPNQIDLNMDFVLLPPSFKEVPRLSHLEYHSPRHGRGKWSVSNSSICPKT